MYRCQRPPLRDSRQHRCNTVRPLPAHNNCLCGRYARRQSLRHLPQERPAPDRRSRRTRRCLYRKKHLWLHSRHCRQELLTQRQNPPLFQPHHKPYLNYSFGHAYMIRQKAYKSRCSRTLRSCTSRLSRFCRRLSYNSSPMSFQSGSPCGLCRADRFDLPSRPQMLRQPHRLLHLRQFSYLLLSCSSFSPELFHQAFSLYSREKAPREQALFRVPF